MGGSYSHGPNDSESEVKVNSESEEAGSSDEKVSTSLSRVKDRVAGNEEEVERSSVLRDSFPSLLS